MLIQPKLDPNKFEVGTKKKIDGKMWIVVEDENLEKIWGAVANS